MTMTQIFAILAAHPLLASLALAALATFIAIPIVIYKIKAQRANLRAMQEDDQRLLDWIGADAYVHLPLSFEPASDAART